MTDDGFKRQGLLAFIMMYRYLKENKTKWREMNSVKKEEMEI